MPATLQSITSKKVTLHIPVDKNDPDSDKLRIVYKPRAITPRLEFAMRRAASEQDEDVAMDTLARHFCALVVEWDLRATEESDEPVPLTLDALRDIPSSVITDIYEAIAADQNPDPKAGSGSRKHS